MDCSLLGERRGRVVPLHEQLPALGLTQHLQRRDGAIRARHGGFEEVHEVPVDAGHGGRVEKIGGIGPIAAQTAGHRPEVSFEIEAHPVEVGPHVSDLDSWQLGVRGSRGHVVDGEGDLEERMAARVALRPQCLDQHLERHVLVIVGVERRGADAAEEALERRVVPQLQPQREHVDEETDQRLDLGAVAAGDWRADGQIALAGGTAEQREIAGEEDHEERAVFAPGERIQGRGEVLGQLERVGGAMVGLGRRPRPVGREVDGRQIGEALAPIGELALEDFALQPLPLPDGEVRILDRQVGKDRRGPFPVRGIEGGHLAGEEGRSTSRRRRCDGE